MRRRRGRRGDKPRAHKAPRAPPPTSQANAPTSSETSVPPPPHLKLAVVGNPAWQADDAATWAAKAPHPTTHVGTESPLRPPPPPPAACWPTRMANGAAGLRHPSRPQPCGPSRWQPPGGMPTLARGAAAGRGQTMERGRGRVVRRGGRGAPQALGRLAVAGWAGEPRRQRRPGRVRTRPAQRAPLGRGGAEPASSAPPPAATVGGGEST